jgi:hypothetical protein
MLSKPGIFHLFLLAAFRAKVMLFAFRWSDLQMSLIAVTNAHFSSLHRFGGRPFSCDPTSSAPQNTRSSRAAINWPHQRRASVCG